ncbi:Gyf domain-containing protein [Thalictrum thalictroides]|uniref:Gyf domain-containing protein n=1 Tax=Thalictrum thalictroides TaxID=46969 RepID=A0A7J6WJ49_THATH|nr:Gyf domain-containing protein [Thalictrum thalictroides]
MAEGTNADSRHSLSLDTLHQIPKDMQGSDNSLPLSPQWLLPKPGDIKHGMVAAGESHLNPYPGYASRLGMSKTSKNGEDPHDTDKKRDVFRPSLHDLESDRRDRWRDEERDTNSAIRRDRRKDGEKEIGDPRKMDRWVETSIRHSVEARRPPSDRWNDSNNRDVNYDQRRDNKWGTRWGPDDKESESWREKLQDSGRDSDLPRDKVMSHVSSFGKEDKEVDHYRPWRSNAAQSRGRGEPPHHQAFPQNKQSSTFNYGKGRGENASNFSVGRGRVSSGGAVLNINSGQPHSLGAALDKGDGFYRDHSSLKYSRLKLLDIYRMTDLRSHGNPLDGLFEIPPSLTQTEALEPLALSAPASEESVILKGIDKGDIVSSGMPQLSKEGSVGRSSTETVQLGRTNIGSREDLPSANDDYKEENADHSKSSHIHYSDSYLEKHMDLYGSGMKSEAIHNLQMRDDSKFGVEVLRSDTASHNRVIDMSISRELSMQGSPAHPSAPWRSESLGERLHESPHDFRGPSPQHRSRTSDVGWSHVQKDRDAALENSLTMQSYYKDQSNWQAREGIHSDYSRESTIRRQMCDALDREHEARKLIQQSSPEDLSLYYKDPQGEIQGPFSGSDLIGWFEAGYFGIDLQVRVANALPGTPFSSLGDVMPHLRAKAKAPPGFGAPKANEIAEPINRTTFSNFGKLHSSEIDNLKTDLRNRNEPMTEAEKMFFESLMSGSLSSSPLEKFASSEGLQGYTGNNPVGMPPLGRESGKDLNYMLAQRMSLERQRSLSNSHSNWPVRDAASGFPKAELSPDPSTPHSKFHPSMVDSPRQVPLSQNVDLISLLQGVADKSGSPAISNGVSSWSNFPVQGGLDMRQDKMDLHHNQILSQTAHGIQQQRLQSPHQQGLTNLIGQTVDNSSGIVTPEKLLSSGLSQDPQMLSLLQQQYMLSQLQLQSQTSAPPQLSLLDKLLLLKQQQKQEQQQQQLLMQQHMLSQVLSEQQSHQHLNESYGHLQGAVIPPINGPGDHLGLRAPFDAYQNKSQASLANIPGALSSGVFPPQDSQDVGHRSSFEASPLLLQQQIFENSSQNVRNVNRKEQIGETQCNEPLPVSTMSSSPPLPEATQSSLHEAFVKRGIVPETYAVAEEQVLQNIKNIDISEGSFHLPASTPDSIQISGATGYGVLLPEQIYDVKNLSSDIFEEIQVQKEQVHCEAPLEKETKSAEALEVKKVSEKKSRKQKSSKANSSSDKVKGVSQLKQSEIEGTNSKDSKLSVHKDAGETFYRTPSVKAGDAKSGTYTEETVTSQQVQTLLPGSISDNFVEELETKDQDQLKEVDYLSLQNSQTQSGHRAWKPAPGVKAKSLKEIQQEEEKVAHKQMPFSDTGVNLVNSSLPWTGIVANAEPKTVGDNHQDASMSQLYAAKSDGVSNPKSRKSQLHDLLAEEVLAKPTERSLDNNDNVSSLPSVAVLTKQMSSAVDDDDFIQAKDSKKSRKKSGKVKGAGVKSLNPVASADALIASSPIEKGKSYRQVQQEKEVLPAPPSGPSLADFVLWKGESTNSSPVPAWSTESGKLPKPTPLRDIQKEQGKSVPSVQHQQPVPTPQKALPIRGTHGSGTSWTLSGSSPSKSAPPAQINSVASAQSKSKAEDDLFWGPLDQSKQEAKQYAHYTDLNNFFCSVIICTLLCIFKTRIECLFINCIIIY